MELLYKIPKLKWLPARHWYDLRAAMGFSTRVRDRVDGKIYRFQCDSFESYQRARTFLGKEPATLDWLRNTLRPDDVFLDIGANIGIFSLFAAAHISERGHVYSCEPHLPTAAQLIRNMALNDFGDRMSVLSIAASGSDGFAPFHYKRWREGASGSQLEIEGNPALAMTKGIGKELKYGLTIDAMVAQGVIQPPALIKIDTDGIEIPITRGMEKLLRSPQRPRSLLIEIQKGEHDEQRSFMASCGYQLVETHLVGKYRRQFEAGATLMNLAFNAIFEPA